MKFHFEWMITYQGCPSSSLMRYRSFISTTSRSNLSETITICRQKHAVRALSFIFWNLRSARDIPEIDIEWFLCACSWRYHRPQFSVQPRLPRGALGQQSSPADVSRWLLPNQRSFDPRFIPPCEFSTTHTTVGLIEYLLQERQCPRSNCYWEHTGKNRLSQMYDYPIHPDYLP